MNLISTHDLSGKVPKSKVNAKEKWGCNRNPITIGLFVGDAILK